MTAIDDAITSGRTALLALLRDAATVTHTPLISDGAGGYLLSTPTTVVTVANVQRQLSAKEAEIAAQLAVISPAVIRLPVGIAAEAGDSIVVSGDTFVVVAPLDGTINLTQRVLCTERTAATEAGSLLRKAARESVLGASPMLYRTTPGTPSADAVTVSAGTRVAYVLQNAGSTRQQAAAGVGVWASDWVLIAPVAQDIQATDKLVSGAYSFLVMAAPEVHDGVLFAPVDRQ